MVDDLDNRWKFIKPCLKPNSVFLDLGSDKGIFSIKIAKEIPNSLVLSFEQKEEEALIQKRELKRLGLFNVILCQHQLTLPELQNWNKYVEAIDYFILSYVLHHFSPDEAMKFLYQVRAMAPNLIVSIPGMEETKATGHDTVKSLEPFLSILQKLYPFVKKIGQVSSYIQPELLRKYYYVKTSRLIREGVGGYRLCWFKGFEKIIEYEEGVWILRNLAGNPIPQSRGKSFEPGINLWNIIPFNIIWPEKEWWDDQVDKAYGKVLKEYPHPNDVRPWNLIVTSKGLLAIDYSATARTPDQLFQPSDLDKIKRIIKQKWIGEWTDFNLK